MTSTNSVPKSKTDQVRTWNMILLSISVVGCVVGWMFFDKDPGQLSFLLGSLMGTTAIGEASARKKGADIAKVLTADA